MPIRMPKIQYDTVELRGGLDQTTPTLFLKPGVARDSSNFECSSTGGYARVGGYERYEGRAKPSNAVYMLVQVVSFTNVPSVGQTLTGATSAATGTIIAVSAAYVVVTAISGTFTGTEVVQVGATVIGTRTALTATVTTKQYAQYQNLAADVYRALIGVVPGSGAVRGVVTFVVGGVDKVYAFRDNAGATGCDMFVASSSGWTQVSYKHKVSFTTGAVALPADGETLTQGGVTALIRRVMASSGTVGASTLAGRFIIDAPSGGNFAAGAATLSGGGTCSLVAVQTAITVLPGGKFVFVEANFTGSASTIRLYGCDGVNSGFEFDGTTFAPILTGAATDVPKHLAAHKNHLVWAIRSSLVISGPGTPYRYLAVDSGAEIATGDTITGLLEQPGGQTTAALSVFGMDHISVLYGTGLSTWNFVPFAPHTGAAHYTAQNMAQSYALDKTGVISLATSQAYGNFEQAALTAGIQTFIDAKRTISSASSVSRAKSQYRLFFTDGSALYMTIVNGKVIGSMPMLLSAVVNCACSGSLVGGGEVSYVGGTNGYVYELDVGSSFDGGDIAAYVTLNWNAMRSPRVRKRYRHASVEMQGSYYAEFAFSYQIGYGTPEIDQANSATYLSGLTEASSWDDFVWDSFYWDGRTLFPTEVDVRGTGENIQVTFTSGTDYIYPFTINSVTTHFNPQRGMR